jgi:chemotaxis protein MotB
MKEIKMNFFEEDDLNSDRSRKKESSDGWVMSFADVVTVLLCFFIVFYMIEKQVKRNKGFGPMKGTVQEFKGKATTPQILTLLDTVRSLPDVEIIGTDQFLEIHFPPASFFKVGSTKINEPAKELINPVAESLSKIGNNFYIQIQGYADPTSVKVSKNRWWKNNMQLSLLRSLSVHNYLLNHGLNKTNLSIAGFGANRPLEGQANKNQRRITIKIEPKDYEQK